MSKNWNFVNIIGLGLNFTYEFEVCSTDLGVSVVNCRQQVRSTAVNLLDGWVDGWGDGEIVSGRWSPIRPTMNLLSTTALKQLYRVQ